MPLRTKKQMALAKAQIKRWPGNKANLFLATPQPGYERPPVIYGEVFCHTMYLCHLLAIFVTGKRGGGNIKPTEGVHKALGTRMRNLLEHSRGGVWLWLCSSKKDDITPNIRKVDKRSYIYGAVFVTGVLETAKITTEKPSKKGCKPLLRHINRKQQFEHSKKHTCQLVVPMLPCCRLELRTPIPLHPEMLRAGEDPRASGMWRPMEGTAVYQALADAEFE
jgi:hypothetical protein